MLHPRYVRHWIQDIDHQRVDERVHLQAWTLEAWLIGVGGEPITRYLLATSENTKRKPATAGEVFVRVIASTLKHLVGQSFVLLDSSWQYRETTVCQQAGFAAPVCIRVVDEQADQT